MGCNPNKPLTNWDSYRPQMGYNPNKPITNSYKREMKKKKKTAEIFQGVVDANYTSC